MRCSQIGIFWNRHNHLNGNRYNAVTGTQRLVGVAQGRCRLLGSVPLSHHVVVGELVADVSMCLTKLDKQIVSFSVAFCLFCAIHTFVFLAQLICRYDENIISKEKGALNEAKDGQRFRQTAGGQSQGEAGGARKKGEGYREKGERDREWERWREAAGQAGRGGR